MRFKALLICSLIFAGTLIADSPYRAQKYNVEKRVPPGEKQLPTDRYLIALEHMKHMKVFSSRLGRYVTDASANQIGPLSAAIPGTWEELGPGNIGGRTRALVFDPSNPNVMYAAAVAGGVWKTTNAGASWTPVGDSLANMAVVSLAIANSNTIYAGTGESFFKDDGVRGAGIFKTTNGGTTWSQLASTNNQKFWYVYDVVVSPHNPQRIYAATNEGVFASTDGGTTWSNQINTDQGSGGCQDLVIRTDAATATDYLLAACGFNSVGTVPVGIYRNKSAESSSSWGKVLDGNSWGRVSLALAPSNQDVIYALVSSNNQLDPPFSNDMFAVFKSIDSGDNWTTQVKNDGSLVLKNMLLTDPKLALCGSKKKIGQGWYDNVIAVDPLDPNKVWAGGIDLFRSADGGKTWGLASNSAFPGDAGYTHPDQHVIAFHPDYDGSSNKTMFVANDGGIWKTADATVGVDANNSAPCGANNNIQIQWTSLNHQYAVTQFYHGLPYPDGTTYFGGTQDNGVIRGNDGAGPDAWEQLITGDGGYVAIDPVNTNTLYAMGPGVSVKKSTNGTTFSTAVNGISGENGLFISPLKMDPNAPNILWTGGIFIWRSTDGAASWKQVGGEGTKKVTALAISPFDSNTVANGRQSGKIGITHNALTSASFSYKSPRIGYVSSVEFSPTDPNTIYASYSSFQTNGGSGDVSVYKSIDGGVTWSPIAGTAPDSIPDIPVHDILQHPGNPSILYAASDLGIFSTLDGGAHWAQESEFPAVPVDSLAFNTASGITSLYAFTHGRGAFRVALGDLTGPDVTITNPSAGSIVNGTVPIQATATDASGIDHLEFVIDGGSIGTDSTIPYQKSWDTTGLTGFHTITVKGFDTVGNVSSKSIQVRVINGTILLYSPVQNAFSTWQLKSGWTASSVDLFGSSKKTLDVLSPAFSCSICTFEADVTIESKKARISLLAWYLDSTHYVEINGQSDTGKWILTQYSGSNKASQSLSQPVQKNTTYHIAATYTGTQILVTIDGTPIPALTPIASTTPTGQAGFRVRSMVKKAAKLRITECLVYQ
jgi:hypothetical protein